MMASTGFNNPLPVFKQNDPSIDYREMEKNLAVHMARMKAE